MDSNQVQKKRNRERTLWISVTVILLTCLVLLVYSPQVLAIDEEAEAQRLLEVFTDIFQYVREHYVDEEQTEPNLLIEGALNGLFEALGDPHSAYLSDEEMRDMYDTTMGRFGGVGLSISKVENGVQVVTPIEDTPAYNAGISAGDIIVEIDGENAIDLNIEEVVRKLRGEPGTTVEIKLIRGSSYTYNVIIERAMIEVPTVKRAMMEENIGYLRVANFTPLTPEKCEEAFEYFASEDYQYLIIDLRNNPGGLLPPVIEVTDFFVSEGPIVSTKSRIAVENKTYHATERKTIVDENIAIVVLVDKGSASASEILAGALQDTGRAIVIGEKTYGKGSVQLIKPVPIGTGGFRLTISRYYTPSGRSIDKIGIEPDRVLSDELSEEEQEMLSRIRTENHVETFVQDHPEPSEDEITWFMDTLNEAGISLQERHIRKLIRNELNKTNNNPPVYDLDYDIVLQEAVKIIVNLKQSIEIPNTTHSE